MTTEFITGDYSPREELANTITHAIGVIAGIAGLILLVATAAAQHDTYNIVGSSVFGASIIFLYTSSTLYHMFRSQRLKRIFRKIDHVAIYLLIAGSYTVFTLSPALRGVWGWSLFGVVWALASVGIILEILFKKRQKVLSIILYVLMGWLVVVSLPYMINAFPHGALLWLFAGGIAYTVGIIFYVVKRIPYNHALWHLFVLAGSTSHYIAAYYCLFPQTQG